MDAIMLRKKSRTIRKDASSVLRFWYKVDKTSCPNGCWLSKPCMGKNVYGNCYYEGVQMGAHRASRLMTHGAIPDGMLVLHNCPGSDNKSCVNPAHLWLGTDQDNSNDAKAKGQLRRPSVEATTHLGSTNGNSKLTEDDVREIRLAYGPGGFVSMLALAEEFGVTSSQINLIVHRKSWKHVL